MSITDDKAMEQVDLHRQSLIAGLWYIAMAILSPLNLIYIPSKLIASTNAALTAQNIMAHEWLFRLGFVTEIAGQIAFLFVGFALYKLFKQVNRDNALTMLLLVVASVPITILNLLNQFGAIILLSNTDYLKVFSPGQLQAFAMVFLDMLKYGNYIAGIFWGLWQ